MTKIDIFSGFLGAGKTTLIKKLIEEAYKGEKVVLIENEFGEIGIDGGFLKEAGVEINEMNSGCICCSLVGDFSEALKKVIADFSPERIIIEPSGVGKLSDVILAVEDANLENAVLNGFTTVVDANKCKMYMKNFGEFFINQVEHAATIILSHTANVSDEKLEKCVEMLREHNEKAVIVTTDWDKLTGHQLLEAIERKNTLEAALAHLHKEDECPVCHGHHDHDEECDCHEHHHHHHDEECDCHEHHHHHHDEECDCHEHHHDHEHHHEHDEECDCHEHHHHHEHEEHEHHHHEHHHEHGEECSCGCHHDHHHEHGHHHHHADEVFTSFGRETTKKFTKETIERALLALSDEEKFGIVLRAKGIVEAEDGTWIHFDYVPGEPDVRSGAADVTGRLCVIGSKLNETAVAELFGL
ncbi:MAG: GTP-binding protein [Clostridia bacterium]|nr:GTP-binding protein [Clostridia bacterium]